MGAVYKKPANRNKHNINNKPCKSDPIDHANESVTRDKLKAGLLAKKHFIVGSNDNSLVDELVDGSTTTLHSHPAQAVSYPASLFTFVKVDVASGTAAQDWKTCSNTISSSIADGAKGVILEAVGKTKLQAEVLQERSLQPKIKIKKVGSPYIRQHVVNWRQCYLQQPLFWYY